MVQQLKRSARNFRRTIRTTKLSARNVRALPTTKQSAWKFLRNNNLALLLGLILLAVAILRSSYVQLQDLIDVPVSEHWELRTEKEEEEKVLLQDHIGVQVQVGERTEPRTEVEDWWQQYVEVASVEYKASNNFDWCQANVNGPPTPRREHENHKSWEKKTQGTTGMYFVKVMKAASSTAAAVALQIAETVAHQKGLDHPCPHHVHHGIQYLSRTKPNFMWTSFRQPHARSISDYFFTFVSRIKREYDSTQLIQKLDNDKNHQIKQTGRVSKSDYLQKEDETERRSIPEELVKVYDIFRVYNFVAVAERMDESLVVMKLLYGFEDEAIVVFPSKHAGGFDDGQSRHQCVKLKKSFTTEDVQAHIAPGGTYRKTNIDYFLLAVANRSLDRTIDALGRDRVEREVLRLRELRNLAEKSCMSEAIFPCQTEGAPPNPKSLDSCYFGDVGCGHECVQRVVRNAKAGEPMEPRREEEEEKQEEHWWQQYVEVASVEYKAPNNTDWCQANVNGPPTPRDKFKTHGRWEKKTQGTTGMYFVKVMKAASSTAAAVALQIAETVAHQKGLDHPCPHHVHHGIAYTKRTKPNFLWTSIRQPHARSISNYFFTHISRNNKKYNSERLIHNLKESKNNQINYIGESIVKNDYLEMEDKSKRRSIPEELVKVYDIFRVYNFLAIAERMDESLVVMKLLYGFEDEAIVVFPSKHAGGFDDGQFKGQCVKLQKSFTTEDVQAYIAPGGTYWETNIDYFLLAVANRSLDRTIDALGRDRVEREVLRLRELRNLAEKSCMSEAIFPCQTEGAPPNPKSLDSCYFGDVGCGHECVQRVVRNAKVGEPTEPRREEEEGVQRVVRNAKAGEPTEPRTEEEEEVWWQQYIEVSSVEYKASNNTDWCQASVNGPPTPTDRENHGLWEKETQGTTGMYFVKVMKAASSTGAAVALQIAETVAHQKGLDHPCPHHVHHGIQYISRNKPNFLWTSIRQPHARSISNYFFTHLSRRNRKYKSKRLIYNLKKDKDLQIKAIGEVSKRDYLQKEDKSKRRSIPEKLVKVYDVFRVYNFVAVAERMDESLVVMKLLYGFEDEAIVVFPSKHAGGFDDGQFRQQCVKLQKSFITEDVQAHIAPGGMYRESNIDYFLLAVANRSLDRTIDALGRERVEREVLRLRELRNLAEKSCMSEAIFPCQTEGAPPNPKSLDSCYFGDVGCGHECVQRVVRNATQ